VRALARSRTKELRAIDSRSLRPVHFARTVGWAVSSAVEHCFHTAGATGSIPVPPTMKSTGYAPLFQIFRICTSPERQRLPHFHNVATKDRPRIERRIGGHPFAKGRFMSDGKIVAVYVGLVRPTRRFAIQRKISANREVFEVYRPKTLHEFVSLLLKAMSSTREDFINQVARLDDEKFQQSKHKTRRYIAEDQEVLNINRPRRNSHSERVLGYWISTDVGRKQVYDLVGLARKAAGVKSESIYSLQL
jgi:hypothetical protein